MKTFDNKCLMLVDGQSLVIQGKKKKPKTSVGHQHFNNAEEIDFTELVHPSS